MSDEFFDKLDAVLSKNDTAKKEKESISDANRVFAKNVMPRLTEIAESYAKKCRDRGISASVKGHEYAVEFLLEYKSGQKRSLGIGPDHDMNDRLSFEEIYPNDGGKRYRSLPTDWYDESNWSDDIFETRLKKTIEDFVFYAGRFGGL